eukprot:scaffold2618_cov240-Pinguiococcus_pyrenoidosus.AAC.15
MSSEVTFSRASVGAFILDSILESAEPKRPSKPRARPKVRSRAANGPKLSVREVCGVPHARMYGTKSGCFGEVTMRGVGCQDSANVGRRTNTKIEACADRDGRGGKWPCRSSSQVRKHKFPTSS